MTSMLAADYSFNDLLDKSGPVLAWSGLLIAVLLIAMVWAMRLKRRLKQDDDVASVPAAGFTLSDLRQMHRAGQISEEEFNKAKEKIVAAAQKTAERMTQTHTAPAKDSIDAIRARRLTREAPQEPPNDDVTPA
jgi:hypothetical protein